MAQAAQAGAGPQAWQAQRAPAQVDIQTGAQAGTGPVRGGMLLESPLMPAFCDGMRLALASPANAGAGWLDDTECTLRIM